VPTTADELVAIAPTERDVEDRSALADAVDFLQEALKDGDQWVKDVKDAAKEAGLSWATVRRAKGKAGVRSVKVGKPGDEAQGWKWHLPEGAHELPKVPIPNGGDLPRKVSIFVDDEVAP
jgi:putative DNA primase/helicase